MISLTVIPGYFLLLKYSPLFLSALSFHIRSTLHNSNTLQQYVFKLMASMPPVGLYQVHIRAKGLESPPIQNIVWCFGPYFTDSTLRWLQIPFQGTKIFPRELYRVPCPEILNCRNPWKLAEISSEKNLKVICFQYHLSPWKRWFALQVVKAQPFSKWWALCHWYYHLFRMEYKKTKNNRVLVGVRFVNTGCRSRQFTFKHLKSVKKSLSWWHCNILK